MNGGPQWRRPRDNGNRRYDHRIVVLMLVVLVTTLALPAQAEPAKVALVHDAAPNVLQQRTITRLRAELAAAGFEVTDITRPGDDAREAAEAEPPVNGVFATIVVVPRAPDAADIWVADRITQKTVVRRVQVGSGTGNDVAAILAVRAVELLQACLLEAVDRPIDESTPRSQPLSPDVSDWMDRRTYTAKPPFSLGAGLGVMHSFGNLGPAVLPVLAFSYRPTSGLSLAVRAGATAFASQLEAHAGTVAAQQQFAAIDLGYEFVPSIGRVRPIALIGAGVYHLDVTGTASSPYQGRTERLLAGLVEIGLGAQVQLGPRVSLVAAVRALFVLPKPVIRAAGEEVGSVSRPSLLGEAAVEVHV
jgi:hypothetical protein